MVEKMLEGIEVRLGVDYFSDKAGFDAMADCVVYTGQIDRYFDYSLGVLEYRMVRFETEVLDCENYQGNAVVNYTEGEEPYYPINDAKNSALYAEYAKLAESQKNVIFGGRLGEYKYYDMDKVIESALKKVEEVI